MATTTELDAAPSLIARVRSKPDGIVWSPAAPQRIRGYQRRGDLAGWAAWVKYLANRKCPRPLTQLLPGGRRVLMVGLNPATTALATVEWIGMLGGLNVGASRPRRGLAEKFDQWLAREAIRPADVAAALETLAACYALPALAHHLPEDLWWRLFQHLLTVTDDASEAASFGDPAVEQLLAGELPLALSTLLPELGPCSTLGLPARSTLSQGLYETVDDSGLPQVGSLSSFPILLACWTRCWALGWQHGEGPLSEPVKERLQRGARCALALSRPGGGMMLTDGESGIAAPRMLPATLATRDALPGAYSESARLALLRASWQTTSPRLAVDFRGRRVRAELVAGGEVLCSGEWKLQVQVNGAPAPIDSDWTENCWFSDEDVDYLELEATLAGGFRVQRQMLLARRDRCLLLADALLGDGEATIEYTSMLPLTNKVAFVAATETREGRLRASRPLAAVLPPALGEWRVDGRPGSLSATDCGLELHQRAIAQRLYAPLLVSFDARHFKQEVTWRQLTVAARREIEPADVAVGYRVRIGKQQWLIYRSLAPPAIRTVLGQNLATEFLFGRFRPTGEVDRLLEIE